MSGLSAGTATSAISAAARSAKGRMTAISAAPARANAPAARRTRTRRLPASLAGVEFARYGDFSDRAAAADAQPGLGLTTQIFTQGLARVGTKRFMGLISGLPSVADRRWIRSIKAICEKRCAANTSLLASGAALTSSAYP